jgi:hypothetical protein
MKLQLSMFVAMLFQVPSLQWQARRQHGGFIFSRKPNVAQECKLGHIRILRDYFAEHPIYDNFLFQHQYQMHCPLFLQIIESMCAHDPYFV